MANEYDIVIIGAGPAGLAAGLYAARALRSTLLIEKNVTGGQIALTASIENYPGIEEINGFDLGQSMQKQAEKYGMETAYTTVTSIEPQPDKRHVIHTDDGDYPAKTVIITAGADYNRLSIPGEERLTGYGVSYCATCDAAFFKDMDVAVVGGGDAAMDEGLFVTRYASNVKVIHRRDELRASAVLQERAFKNEKMDFVWDTVVDSVDGDKEVKSLQSEEREDGREVRAAGGGRLHLHRPDAELVLPARSRRPGPGRPRHRQRLDGDQRPRHLRRGRYPSQRCPSGHQLRRRRRHRRHPRRPLHHGRVQVAVALHAAPRGPFERRRGLLVWRMQM